MAILLKHLFTLLMNHRWDVIFRKCMSEGGGDANRSILFTFLHIIQEKFRTEDFPVTRAAARNSLSWNLKHKTSQDSDFNSSDSSRMIHRTVFYSFYFISSFLDLFILSFFERIRKLWQKKSSPEEEHTQTILLLIERPKRDEGRGCLESNPNQEPRFEVRATNGPPLAALLLQQFVAVTSVGKTSA